MFEAGARDADAGAGEACGRLLPDRTVPKPQNPAHPPQQRILHAPRRRGFAHLFILGLIIAVVPGLVSPVSAQPSVRFLSTAELYARLDDTRAEVRESGRHYIMGVVDALVFARDPEVCLGAQARLDDLVAAVHQRLASRPELLRYNAASVVRQVVAASLKCS